MDINPVYGSINVHCCTCILLIRKKTPNSEEKTFMAVTEEKNVTHIYVRVCYCDQNSYFLPKMGDIFFKEGCKLCFRVAKLLSDMTICLGLFPQTSPGKKKKKRN